MMTEALANIHLTRQQQLHHQQQQQQQIRKVEKTPTMINKTSSSLNMFNMNKQEGFKRGGSFVIGQKLRESKWFNHDELKIFCAVVESGFIIEHKDQEDATRYGVAIWTPGYEKSKNPEYLTIYTITETKGKFKVLTCTLAEYWPDATSVRINNKSDKTETPLTEEAVRHQIEVALNSKKKWHNTEHFAYYCRYGPVDNHARTRKITDSLRWNTGTFFLKIRSLTTK